MKILLTTLIFSLFCSSLLYGQQKPKGYGEFGVGIHYSEKFQSSGGLFMTAGIAHDRLLTGVTAEGYFFGSNKTKFGVIAADIKLLLGDAKDVATPFINIKPGAVIYNQQIFGITTKGGLSIEGSTGVRFAPNKKLPGFKFSLGAQRIEFRTKGKTSGYTGFKIQFALSF